MKCCSPMPMPSPTLQLALLMPFKNFAGLWCLPSTQSRPHPVCSALWTNTCRMIILKNNVWTTSMDNLQNWNTSSYSVLKVKYKEWKEPCQKITVYENAVAMQSVICTHKSWML
jgi:hypothetical protein